MSNLFDNFKLPNETLSYNDLSNSSHESHFSINENSSSATGFKETGIIEKMLSSYGFIQCCERQARLFFHFSQYSGNIEQLKIGDSVEYEMSHDRRTGKPIAIQIKKISSDDFMMKLSKTESLSGVIATPIVDGGRVGRVAFENLGEFFFLPFSQEDVLDKALLHAGDKVSFILHTDESGNYRAKSLKLETSSSSNYKGVVRSVKDTFGFIERSDKMTNIFFHSSDCEDFKSLNFGDCVEFNITTRKNKELAINVTKVANTIEEYSEQVYKGQIIRYNNRSNLISGIINCPELNKEFVFYDKDINGSFTLNLMDLVNFQIVTDLRSQSQRACNVTFLMESFVMNSEKREKGYIASIKDSYGFINCPNKGGSPIYFKTSELLDPQATLKLNDDVEFTYISDNQNRKFQAIRVSIIPNGSLFNIPSTKKSDNIEFNSNDANSYPLIDFNTELNDTQNAKVNGNSDNYFGNNCSNDLVSPFANNDNANANSYLMDSGLENYDLFDSVNNHYHDNGKISNFENNKEGIIVALTDKYGFIESIDGENEYYFNISSYADANRKLGQPVEFSTFFSNGKWKANDVHPKQSITLYEDELSEVYNGIVVRTVEPFANEQSEYTGLIARFETSNDTNDGLNINEKYEFSLLSCKFLKDYVSVDDIVKFQVATNSVTKKKRAYNVEVIRERVKGTIHFLHRLYGFVKPELQTLDSNIYFNKAEVPAQTKLKVGDTVDFYVVKNRKTDKTYAIDINKLNSSNKSLSSDLTIYKTSSVKIENGPKVIVIRQPKAPDGTKGFQDRL